MKAWRLFGAVCCLFLLHDVSAAARGTGAARAAIAVTNQEAAAAESVINGCGGTAKPFIDCVAGALDGFANGLGRGDIPQKAPQAASAIAQAAAGLKAAPNKAAALSVLNRAASVLQAQAAKTSGESADVYVRANRVISRAISAINRKG